MKNIVRYTVGCSVFKDEIRINNFPRADIIDISKDYFYISRKKTALNIALTTHECYLVEFTNQHYIYDIHQLDIIPQHSLSARKFKYQTFDVVIGDLFVSIMIVK
jgi:hypothetical protein